MPERLPRFLPEPSKTESRFALEGFERLSPFVAEDSKLTETINFKPIDMPHGVRGDQLIQWAEQHGGLLTFEDAEFLRGHTQLLQRPDLMGKTIYFLGTLWKRQNSTFCLVLRRNKDRWFYRFDPLGSSDMKDRVVLQIEQSPQLD